MGLAGLGIDSREMLSTSQLQILKPLLFYY